jgi:hypothetical protein
LKALKNTWVGSRVFSSGRLRNFGGNRKYPPTPGVYHCYLSDDRLNRAGLYMLNIGIHWIVVRYI